MSELKPCPFCGIVPTVEGDPFSEEYIRGYNSGLIGCRNVACAFGGEYISKATQKEATTIWNTRPIEDALRAELARRDEIITRLKEDGERLVDCIEYDFFAHEIILHRALMKELAEC